MNNDICAFEDCKKVSNHNSIYCSDSCKMKRYRQRKKRSIAAKLAKAEKETLRAQAILENHYTYEPYIVLSEGQSKRIREFAKGMKLWPPELTEDEMMLIKDGHQIFLLRWVNALRPYYGGDVIAKVAMRYE